MIYAFNPCWQQYSKQLEDTMENFAGGDVKILLCTNIVESGLDIQNANTIIIQDVQLFGLAQLYQVLLVPFTTFWALLRCVYLILIIETEHNR